MVPVDLIYAFAGGAFIIGLLSGLVLGLVLRGGREASGLGVPPSSKMKTGIALVKDPDGAWWLEIGERRYQHLQEIYDDQTAMLVLEAFQAIRGMAEGSTERLLPISGTAPSMPALAEQLDHILQELLRRYPELPYRAVRFETLPDGTLGIIAGGQRYRHPEEVPDPQLRALLQEAIQRWEGKKGAG